MAVLGSLVMGCSFAHAFLGQSRCGELPFAASTVSGSHRASASIFLSGSGREDVDTELCLLPYLYKSGVTQNPQVPRGSWTGDRQQCRQLTWRLAGPLLRASNMILRLGSESACRTASTEHS